MRAWLIATAALLATTSICLAQASKPAAPDKAKKLGGIEYRTEDMNTKNSESRQYQVDVDKKKDLFLYGQTTKMDPTYRQPGQSGLPGNAVGEPETRYGIGLGVRF